jgi:hypothetical protein
MPVGYATIPPRGLLDTLRDRGERSGGAAAIEPGEGKSVTSPDWAETVVHCPLHPKYDQMLVDHCVRDRDKYNTQKTISSSPGRLFILESLKA